MLGVPARTSWGASQQLYVTAILCIWALKALHSCAVISLRLLTASTNPFPRSMPCTVTSSSTWPVLSAVLRPVSQKASNIASYSNRLMLSAQQVHCYSPACNHVRTSGMLLLALPDHQQVGSNACPAVHETTGCYAWQYFCTCQARNLRRTTCSTATDIKQTAEGLVRPACHGISESLGDSPTQPAPHKALSSSRPRHHRGCNHLRKIAYPLWDMLLTRCGLSDHDQTFAHMPQTVTAACSTRRYC